MNGEENEDQNENNAQANQPLLGDVNRHGGIHTTLVFKPYQV